jgi:hypothetical protein
MTNLKHQIILLICIVVLPFIVIFGWMSYRQAKTEFMETKVRQAFDKEVTALSPQWTRIEVHDNSQTYYSPIINSSQSLELYRYVLEDLNQDENVPLVKMTLPAITKSFGSSEDLLTCQAIIEFPLILGIDRTMMIYSTVKMPHYTNLK